MSDRLASGVWTERRPAPQGWSQCTGCAWLMALAYGGHDFGEALNTDAERDAFEPQRTDPAGHLVGENLAAADASSRARYGITLPVATNPLGDLLATAGLGLTVQGINSRLPTELHRWDPAYQGGHDVFVIGQGGATVWWYDPEAPRGYAGESVPVATVLHWAYGSGDTFRAVHPGQFSPASPHHDFRVKAATALWNDQTSRWVFSRPAIPVGATGVCRGAGYMKGGKLCYPLVSMAPNRVVPAGIAVGSAYFIPSASVVLTS